MKIYKKVIDDRYLMKNAGDKMFGYILKYRLLSFEERRKGGEAISVPAFLYFSLYRML